MVVITLIIMVTLPITKNKLSRIDYFAYYMGYKIANDISANIVSKLEILSYTQNNKFSSIELLLKNKYKKFISYIMDSSAVYAAMPIGECTVHSVTDAEECPAYNYTNITEDDCIFNMTQINKQFPFCDYGYSFSDFEDESGSTEEGEDEEESEDPKLTDYKLCEKIESMYNLTSSNCTLELSSSIINDGDFSTIENPHIVLSNGLILHILSGKPDTILDLQDSADEYDRLGFTIYIDLNGKSGKSKLYEDVFPFYLLLSGKVVPAYNPAIIAGANNKDHLSINVLYDDYTEDKREVKFLLKDANFRKATCATGYVTSKEYCGDKVQYDKCKDTFRDCRFIIKAPIKIF